MDSSRALLIKGSNRAFFCKSTGELLFSIAESVSIVREVSKNTDYPGGLIEKCMFPNCISAFILHWCLF